MDFKEKTVSGLSWAFASRIARQGVSFAITVILARLLTPKDFGLMGMAFVFIGFTTAFSDMGISAALIHKQYTDERHLSSAFWLNIAAGIILTIGLIIFSGAIAGFYRQPELKKLLVILSCNYLLASFTIVQQAILTKEMNFKALAVRDMAAVIAAGATGIYLAFRGFGVESLVYQLLVSSLVNGVSLWVLSKWRPKFLFSPKAIKDIFCFSVSTAGFQLVNYIARNMDFFLIGKFLGAEPLGYYSLAYRLMLAPLRNVSYVINKVLFPAFSKIQQDLIKVRSVYLRMVKAVSFISIPMMCILFALAPEFINIFYGVKWSPAVGLVRVFCFCGLVQSITAFNATVYISQGRPDIQLKMSLVSTTALAIVIMLGLKKGIFGVALYYTVFHLIWANFSLYILNRLIKLKLSRVYSNIAGILFSGLLTMIIILSGKPLFFYRGIGGLLILLFLSGGVYFSLLFFTRQIKLVKNKLFFNWSSHVY